MLRTRARASPAGTMTGGRPGSEDSPESPDLAAAAGAPEAASPAPTELDQVVGRALEFQGFLLRRAWGIYYLSWAVALVVLFVVPGTFADALSSATIPEAVLYDALQGAAIVLVIWVTWWAVAQSARAGRLRDTLEGRPLARRWFAQILGVALAITALVVVVGFVNVFAGYLVLDASVGGVVLWLLFQARPWFRPVPPEATLAVVAFAASIGASAAVLVVTRDPRLFASAWLVATGAWAFAGAYALYHAPEEMTGGAHG